MNGHISVPLFSLGNVMARTDPQVHNVNCTTVGTSIINAPTANVNFSMNKVG